MTRHEHNAQSYKENSPLQKIKLITKKKKIQPNHYPSIVSVDSSTTESTCIFPEMLNKHINACVENTSKTKINFLFHKTQNKDIYHE